MGRYREGRKALTVFSSPSGLAAFLAPAGVSCQARARSVRLFSNWVKKHKLWKTCFGEGSSAFELDLSS